MKLTVRKSATLRPGRKTEAARQQPTKSRSKARSHTNETETSCSADAAMFFVEDKEKMSTNCSKLENAGSLELSRVA